MMKSVLIIKNTPAEGPGTIGDFLSEQGIEFRTIEASRGEKLPPLKEQGHIVVMGGPMGVYEMDAYPFLRDEASYLKEAISGGKRLLGICLGAQMLAHALGARVYRGGTKEIGWYEVDITPEGVDDPIFSALMAGGSPKAQVFHWHGDTFDLPSGAIRLAFNENYSNQAFKYDDRLYALQFHIEVTPDIIGEWFKGEKNMDVKGMIEFSEEIYPEYRKRAWDFYKKFFGQPTI
jgi:GMP synthase-like glutamine amidotransferase